MWHRPWDITGTVQSVVCCPALRLDFKGTGSSVVHYCLSNFEGTESLWTWHGHSFIVNVKILEGVPNHPPWQTCKVFHAWVHSFTRLRYYTYASTCSLACFRCFSTFCLACTLSATVCRMSSAFWVQPWAFACSRAFTGRREREIWTAVNAE